LSEGSLTELYSYGILNVLKRALQDYQNSQKVAIKGLRLLNDYLDATEEPYAIGNVNFFSFYL
jgi:hypothetical protein